jgi:hypothetical protein
MKAKIWSVICVILIIAIANVNGHAGTYRHLHLVSPPLAHCFTFLSLFVVCYVIGEMDEEGEGEVYMDMDDGIQAPLLATNFGESSQHSIDNDNDNDDDDTTTERVASVPPHMSSMNGVSDITHTTDTQSYIDGADEEGQGIYEDDTSIEGEGEGDDEHDTDTDNDNDNGRRSREDRGEIEVGYMEPWYVMSLHIY